MADLPLFEILAGLLGGLALFLLGMDHLTESLKAIAGDRMKTVLARLAGRAVTGAVTGAAVTAVIQSSSVTTVLVVGFISAGVMSVAQAVGVIMGANVGTTITAQIIAFKVTQAALPLIAAGFAAQLFARRDWVRQSGGLVLGLGLVFFGMVVMGEGVAPLRAYPPFTDMMVSMANPLTGILVGALFTALVQSSSATTGVVIVLAGQGAISLEAGISLVLGANIGTCVTALLATIGKPRAALQAGLVHVLFNVLGALLWLALIPELAALARALSPAAPELEDAARRAAVVPRQVANAHTVFNVINTMIFLPFAGVIGRAAEWLVPVRPAPRPALPDHLKEELLTTPSLAMDAVRRQIGAMGRRTEGMLADILPATLHGTRESLEAIAARDKEVDVIHAGILEYLRRLGRAELSESQGATLFALMEAANVLETVGDVIETDLVRLGRQRLKEGVHISDETEPVLAAFHGEELAALRLATAAVESDDPQAAERVIAMKPDIQARANEAARHGADRLQAEAPNRLATYTREMEVIERLRRIYYFAKRLAKGVVADAEEPEDIPDADEIVARA